MTSAITSALGSAGEMRVRDIHAAVELGLGQAVSRSSVKNCLATQCHGPDRLFERTERGRYRLM